MLLALDSCDEVWPPFGADIVFELYLQTMGPSCQSHSSSPIQSAAVNSNLDWGEVRMEQMWVRVRYLGQGLPLASEWCSDSVRQLTGSEEYVPLHEFVQRITPMALSLEDYWQKCREALTKAKADGENEMIRRVPKNI